VDAKVDEAVILRHLEKHSLAKHLTTEDLIRLTRSKVSTKMILKLQDMPVSLCPDAPPTYPSQAVPAQPSAEQGQLR
jgi:hypothetical protein